MKKKLLFRIGTLRHGGAEKVLLNLLKNLPKDKYDIDVLLDLKMGKYIEELPSWINLYHIKVGNFYGTNSLKTIHKKAFTRLFLDAHRYFPNLIYKRILSGKKYDVEICANDVLWPDMLRSPLDSKKIVWVHKNPSSRYSDKSIVTQKIKEMLKADSLLCISNQIIDEFKSEATDKQAQKIVHFFNPIDLEEIKNKLPKSGETKPPENSVVAIGTVYEHKGFDRLLKVHDRLLNEGVGHKISVVGDGYDFPALQQMLKDFKREETFNLLGFQSNPYSILNEHQIFCLSSRAEGFPTVLIEALYLKKVIVATDVSGVRELLENGEYGLITNNSEEGLYEGLKQVLTSSELKNKLAQSVEGHQFKFNIESSVKQFMDVVDALV